MLTTDEIRGWLARVTYKPGWFFTVYDGEWEGQHFVITALVPDAYNPGATTVLDVHSALPPIPNQEYLWHWITWRVGRVESHEMREFLRVEGDAIHDPHAPNAERDNPDYEPLSAWEIGILMDTEDEETA
jgi:hypothetical protein